MKLSYVVSLSLNNFKHKENVPKMLKACSFLCNIIIECLVKLWGLINSKSHIIKLFELPRWKKIIYKYVNEVFVWPFRNVPRYGRPKYEMNLCELFSLIQIHSAYTFECMMQQRPTENGKLQSTWLFNIMYHTSSAKNKRHFSCWFHLWVWNLDCTQTQKGISLSMGTQTGSTFNIVWDESHHIVSSPPNTPLWRNDAIQLEWLSCLQKGFTVFDRFPNPQYSGSSVGGIEQGSSVLLSLDVGDSTPAYQLWSQLLTLHISRLTVLVFIDE